MMMILMLLYRIMAFCLIQAPDDDGDKSRIKKTEADDTMGLLL